MLVSGNFMMNKKESAAPDVASDRSAKASSHIAAKRTVGIVSFLLFIGLLVLITVKIGIPLVNSIFSGGDGVNTFWSIVDGNPLKARLLYIGIQVLQVFIAFIPGEAVEIAGGLAFGAWEGLLLSLIGVAIGSCIIFFFSKTLGLKFVRLFVSEERLNDLALIRSDSRLNLLVFLMFFIPGTPKDALTYIVGLTRMKLPAFLLISLVARIPSVLTSTWGGDSLINGEYLTAAIFFGVTGILGLAGMLAYKKISSKHGKEKNGISDNSEADGK